MKAKYIKSRLPHKLGNKKIGLNTIVFNIGPAHECISLKKGLCQVENKCYALRDEKRYPNTLNYRLNQAKAWDTLTVKQIAHELFNTILKHDIKFIRFNESGDFRNQADLTKLKRIARILSFIPFYGYTSRSDLRLNKLPSNLIINGSGFMVSNMFEAIKRADITDNMVICPGSCIECHLCKSKANRDIKVVIH
jgi:hypothetical protein